VRARFGSLGFVILLASFLMIASPAWGQNNATLQGTVTDTSGAAIPNAKITVTNQATQVSRTSTTSATGFYVVGQLPPGNYTVTVEATGFQKSETSNVVVLAEQFRGLDLTLQVGKVSQTVTVNGENQPLLQTENADITGTLTNQEVQQLPKFSRDPYELLRLTPGIFGDGARSGVGQSAGFPNGPGANNGGSAGPGGSNSAIYQTENQQSISSNGQRITANDYTVDGVSVNSLQWGGAAVITPSPDSVQEITVVSNDYDASDGRNSGAHIKVVTKSGTNQFHGGGFFELQDPGLNSYNKFGGFIQGVGNAPPQRDSNAFRQFGGDLGGPIIRNKLFFFFNYEGLHDNSTAFSNQWIDTTQFDSTVIGARGGTPVATTLSDPGIRPRVNQILTTTCAFWLAANQPCQVVSGGVDIGSPGGTYGTYINSFGSSTNPPNFTGGGLDGIPDLQFAQLSIPSTSTGKQYNARVDYTMGRNMFSASTFVTFYDALNADASAQSRPMSDYKTHRVSPSGFLSWVFTISPTTVNDARFNFTRWAFNDISANPQINWAIPRTEIQGLPINGQRIIFGATQGDTSPGIFAQNTFAFRDMVSKMFNRHSVKFGIEYDHEQDNSDLLGSARPDYVFQEPWNFANGTPIFEQIAVNPLTGGPTDAARYYRESDYGLFVQDDWKVRPNLTLNLGLRWDYYGPPSEARGNLENIIPGPDPTTGLQTAVAVMPGHMYNATWRNLGPKLGFAWSPDRFHGNAVVRGGFGIAYDRFDDISFDNTRDNPPLIASYGICCGTAGQPGDGFGTPFVNGQIVYEQGTSNSPLGYAANPNLATPLNPATNLPEILSGQGAPNVWSNPQKMPVPYVYEYSMQGQYALPQNWVATIGYSGSSSHKLLRIKNLAYFYPVTNPDINAVFTFTPDTNANYNALNALLQHRFNKDFTANISYTYSKSIDQMSAEGPGFLTNQTYPTNDSTEWGPSDYNNTHRVLVYGIWDLPIFRGRSDLLGKSLGGWEITGVFQYHSGFPWTPVSSNNCFTLGAQFLCPVRPIGYFGGAGRAHNTPAFLPPASSNFFRGATSYFNVTSTGFPGIGRNSFVGPRYTDVDFSFMKQFGLPAIPVLGENAKIELRANLFNAFNKLNLAPFTFGSSSTTVSYFNNSSGVPVDNPLFGTASAGLAGRVVELEGRFIF